MTMLYLNLCYKEVCYNGTTLYLQSTKKDERSDLNKDGYAHLTSADAC